MGLIRILEKYGTETYLRLEALDPKEAKNDSH